MLVVKKGLELDWSGYGKFCFIHVFELAANEELLALRPMVTMGGLELVESKSCLHSWSKLVCISSKQSITTVTQTV